MQAQLSGNLQRRQMVRSRHRAPLSKGDIALADLTGTPGGGYLVAQQSRSFMEIMIKTSKFLPDITVVGMQSHTYNIDKMSFQNDVLQVANEGQELAESQRSKPSLEQSVINAKAFKAEVWINDFVLEDSIEGPALANRIKSSLAKAIARDMEKIVLLSDTTDVALALKYRQFDGIFKKISTNTVNANTQNLNKTVLRDMLRAMPSEFLEERQRLVYYTSIDADLDYRDATGDRQTVLGDKSLQDYVPAVYSGVPMKAVPLFPENLGGGSNTTNALLLDPKNAHLGIWRKMRVESDKNVRAGVLMVVASMRFGFNLAVENATVKATGIKVTA